ncbi:MAG TPA: ATP-binding protein [Verrucomicrobiae bacterium]|jgi:signal transduction histidine kinase
MKVSRPASDTTLNRITQLSRHASLWASLRVRLIILVLIAVLPALGLVIYTAVEQRRQGGENAATNAMAFVRLAAISQDQHLEASRQLLLTLAQLKEVRAQDRAACQALFTNLLSLHKVYANIGAIDLHGDVFASALGLTNPVNLSERRYFQNAVTNRSFAIGEYQVGKITGKATINVGYPVLDDRGQVQAVVFAALDLAWLKAMITNSPLPPGSSLTLLDRKLTTLVRYPDPEGTYTGQVLQSIPRPSPRSTRPRREGPFPTEGTLRLHGRDGIERLYAVTRLGRGIDPKPPIIAIGIPVSQAYAAANCALRRNLIWLGIVATAAMAAAWFGGDVFLLRRVRNLVAATVRLSKGDLKARAEIQYGKGELGTLARAFDAMAASLEQRVAERERAQAELKALNEALEHRVAERTRELKRSNEDLEQFAYVASHDLQEPLRMVASFTQLLARRYKDQLDKDAREFIYFAVDGAARMQTLIHDLLAYSRLGTRGKPFQTIDLNHLLSRVLVNLKVAIDESKAVITHDPLPTVTADGTQLTQLLQNLLGNAIKFRADKPPHIHVAVARRGGDWLFSVRDNGIGINQKYFDRIFVIFQRLHSRLDYPGTGIGLALCKKIVERHGGRIWVESAEGKGTTFYFLLPATP